MRILRTGASPTPTQPGLEPQLRANPPRAPRTGLGPPRCKCPQTPQRSGICGQAGPISSLLPTVITPSRPTDRSIIQPPSRGHIKEATTWDRLSQPASRKQRKLFTNDEKRDKHKTAHAADSGGQGSSHIRVNPQQGGLSLPPQELDHLRAALSVSEDKPCPGTRNPLRAGELRLLPRKQAHNSTAVHIRAGFLRQCNAQPFHVGLCAVCTKKLIKKKERKKLNEHCF